MGSLKDRQVEALRSMLTLDPAGAVRNNNVEPSWKVLIYDQTGSDILGPLLSVKELRELGVTLHLRLHSKRDNIPDAPAVYFCLPTDENIQRMCQDLNNQLYAGYYYNFISPVTRSKLEDLASSALQSGSDSLIQKIFDQYTNFICLEPEMFSLRTSESSEENSVSYYSMNKGSVKDNEMDSMLSSITDSLFALCVTLGTVPIIRCPSGNAAEAVASKLDKKLRDNLKDARNSLFNDGTSNGRYSFHRPVLVLVDRSVDFATPLHHTWTYQALAHDVLQYNQNRVKMNKKEYDLDAKDKFWMEHKGSPFPQVAEAIEMELKEIKGKEDEITSMKRELGLEGGEMEENIISNLSLSDNTSKLTNAVSSLPELLQKKSLIDMHCSLATSILEIIKNRRLDVFFELEEKIMSGAALDKSLLEILTDSESGTGDDKLRLFLIYFLLSPNVTDAELDELTGALLNSGVSMASLTYLKRIRNFSMVGNKQMEYSSSQGGTTKTMAMFSSLISQSSNLVMAGVKNLVVKKHNLPLTKIVDDIMEQKQGKYNDEYKYLDPKILRGNEGGQVPRTKTQFNDAIVFVVGGGNYIEYQNLQDYVRNKNAGHATSSLSSVSQKRIIYGSTQMMNADQFLSQLTKLGKEISGEMF